MSNASLVLSFKTELSETTINDELLKQSGDPKGTIQALIIYLRKLGAGNARGNLDAQTSATAPVAASGTLTLVSVIATDVFVVGSETFTFTSTPATENDVEVDGASDTLDAEAAVAAINAHSVTGLHFVATNVAGVITITAKAKGSTGNELGIASVDSTITASGAFLTGGTGGAESAVINYSLGIA